MTALVKRDDLTTRTALSKSSITGFDRCASQAWHDIHFRRPLTPAEHLTFGSAVDAAVETVIKFLRSEQPVEEAVCLAAAQEVIDRDVVAVSIDEVEHALLRFMVEVAPHYDFRYAKTQEHITGEHPDFGEIDSHPDVWLADGRIFDVKTSQKEKTAKATLELGFYALVGADFSGKPVPAVGYWTWARTSRPHWQILEFPVTDWLVSWTVEKTAAFVRAKRIDAQINATKTTPENWAMTSGPKFGCYTLGIACQYMDICPIAEKKADDVAAA